MRSLHQGAVRKEPILLFFGGYDPEYPRNSIIRKGWLKCGFSVFECRVSTKRKLPTRYPALIWQYVQSRRAEHLFFVPDFRHKDVPLAWILSRLSGKKVVFDPLVSRYETKVLDRRDAAEGSLQAWHNRNLDRLSFSLSDLILADTAAHARYYRQQFSLVEEKVRILPVGFDEEIFKESPLPENGEKLKVLFYGTYLPLHGVETIVEAASILRDRPVTFNLVGKGQTYEGVRELKKKFSTENLSFHPRLPVNELVSLMTGTDVILGIFGVTLKAGMVVPNKVYQALAVGRPVITADTPAIRELFQDGVHLLTVPPGDARALAHAIEALRKDPGQRRQIASQGGSYVRSRFSSLRIAERLATILDERGLF